MSDSQIVRPYGDTTGRRHGAAVASRCPCRTTRSPRAPPLQLANKMGIDPALVVHAKPMGPDFTFFVVYGRVHHLVDVDKVEVVERDYPLLTPKEVNAAVKRVAAPSAGRRGGLHRHRRAHGRHRRDPQHQGVRGGEGPGVLPRAQGGEPRRPGLGPAARRAGPGGEGRRRAGLPGGHPARRAPAQHPRDVARRSARPTPPSSDRCWSSAAPASTSPWPSSSASTGCSPAAPPPARSRRFLVAPASSSERRPDGRDRPRGHHRGAPPLRPLLATPTTPATSSTAPTRWACSGTWPPSCASAPTATRGSSRRTPTCSSCSPVRAGDVVEVTATLVRVGTRSRGLDFTVHVVARGAATQDRPGAAEVLAEPLLATSATGTVVVPPRVR